MQSDHTWQQMLLVGNLSINLIFKLDFWVLLNLLKDFFKETWWLWLFLILWRVVASTWLFWRNELFKRDINWIFLEIKIPFENKKEPLAMEQVLTLLHSLRNAPSDIEEKWLIGEVTRWFSLEIVSFGGEIHYYIRVYKKQRNLVEAAFHSYYPEIEFVEVEDYVNKFPQSVEEMYAQQYDLWGTEILISKPAFYPIKTYGHFLKHPDKEKRIDPMAVYLEVLGKLKLREIVGIQILIAPKGNEWKDKYQKDLEALKSEVKEKKVTTNEGFSSDNQIVEETFHSKSDYFIVREVEENLSKPAFDTLIRFIYLSPKETFYDSYARRGLVGIFNQFAHLKLNSFRQNYKITTRTLFWYFPYFFPNLRNDLKKERLLRNYRLRDLPPQTFMGRVLTSHPLNWNFASKTFEMNVECLATIFHIPTELVLTTPFVPRIESKKTSPPAGLPIFGQEGEIEKFK